MKCITLSWLYLALVSVAFHPAAAQSPYSFTNFAGLPGTPGTNDGPVATARFNSPAGIIMDPAGNVVVADYGNHSIRKISPAGVVSTYAGSPGQVGFVDGPLAEARFNGPYFLAYDAGTNLYVSDHFNHVIRKITPAGTVSTFAGGGGLFNRPAGIAFDPVGNLYIVDSHNHVLRFVTPGGLVLTLAGAPGDGGFNNGAANLARFYYPSDLAVDAVGNTYVADAGGYMIRKMTPGGTVSTVAGAYRQLGFNDGTGGAASFTEPTGIRFDTDGSLLVGDSGNHLVRRVTPAGAVSTLGGAGGQVGIADGIGAAARFNRPLSFALDGTGGFFVTDPFNHRISRATPVRGLPLLATVPTSQTFGPQGTTLSVTATGTAPLAYQWQLNGTNLPNATDATFAIAGNATGAGRYTVTVTNVLGAATSAEALLLFFDGLRFYAGMSLTGVVGRQYRVDFADIAGGVTNWVALTNLTLTANPVMVIDPTSAGLTNRSYRAVLLP